MRQRLALLLTVVLTTATASSQAQVRREGQSAPTFGAEIEVVNLNVSVTNPQGQYVTRLGQNDFSVFEDGVRQELVIFKHEDLPLSMVLVLDGSASMTDKMKDVQGAAKRFLQTLRPGDQAQLVQFSDRINVLQEFTSDVKALEEALHRAEASGPTALHNALYVSLKDLSNEKRKVGGELRRRAIVLLSDGEDTSSLVTDDQVLDLAKKTEINIYPILIRSNRVSDSTRPSFSQADYLLTTLARETGGQSFMPNSMSELDKVYDRIAEELRTLFSLGYVSSNPRRDGKWRRIVVRVNGREDLLIRHKLGYYAPSVTR